MKKILTATFLVLFLLTGSSVVAQSTQENNKDTNQNEPKTVKLKITGMTCAGCASRLSKVLSDTPGILDNSVEYPGDISVVKYDSETIKTEGIVKIIGEKTTFSAEIFKEKPKTDN